MNANKRMKYASTPTYGMQKRGFSKKAASAQQPPAPDFTQYPMQDPFSSPFSQQNMTPFSPTVFSQNAGLQQPSPYPPLQQNIPSPGGMAFQTQPLPQNNINPFQPVLMANGGSSLQQPLGNNPLVAQGQAGGYSPRQQGFVPPMTQAAIPALQNNVIPANAKGQDINPLGVSPFSQTQAFPSSLTSPYMAQSSAPALNPGLIGGSPMGMSPMQQPSLPMQPMQPYPQQQTMAKSPRQPMDRDKVWMGFLFGLLPLLFIPCLLVGQALDLLRYAFITLCVIGLGAMWYRQMFASSTRMTISIIYAALCIVTISLLLNGSAPAQPTSASGMQAQMQTTPDPNALAAAQPSESVPEETPSPITPLGQSDAELRLIAFMDLWAANQNDELISYILPSWASTKENPAAELFTTVITNRTPEEYVIESISGTDADSSRTVTLSAYINKNNGKDPVRYRFMILMEKSGDEWYIDPNTLGSNDVLLDSGTSTTNDTSSAQVTAAPRMTETPVPDLDTLLYYNPNGGSYYHADEYCASAKSEFLPFQGSFRYSELGSYKNLQPCLECRAPTTVLEQ